MMFNMIGRLNEAVDMIQRCEDARMQAVITIEAGGLTLHVERVPGKDRYIVEGVYSPESAADRRETS